MNGGIVWVLLYLITMCRSNRTLITLADANPLKDSQSADFSGSRRGRYFREEEGQIFQGVGGVDILGSRRERYFRE